MGAINDPRLKAIEERQKDEAQLVGQMADSIDSAEEAIAKLSMDLVKSGNSHAELIKDLKSEIKKINDRLDKLAQVVTALSAKVNTK